MKDLDDKIIEILACPVCKGSLKQDKVKKALICGKCNKFYPIREGIPILMPPKLD